MLPTICPALMASPCCICPALMASPCCPLPAAPAVAERIGVFAEPEVVTKQLTASHPFIVIASDGVFEFLTSQSVVDMVRRTPHKLVTIVSQSECK